MHDYFHHGLTDPTIEPTSTTGNTVTSMPPQKNKQRGLASRVSQQKETERKRIDAENSRNKMASLKYMTGDTPIPCTEKTLDHPLFFDGRQLTNDASRNEMILDSYRNLATRFVRYWKDQRGMGNLCLQILLKYLYVRQKYSLADGSYKVLKIIAIKEFPSFNMEELPCDLPAPANEILIPTSIVHLCSLKETFFYFYSWNAPAGCKRVKSLSMLSIILNYKPLTSPTAQEDLITQIPSSPCNDTKSTISQIRADNPGYSLEFSFEKELPIKRWITFPCEWGLLLSQLKNLIKPEQWGPENWYLGFYLSEVANKQMQQNNLIPTGAKLGENGEYEEYALNLGLVTRGMEPVLMVLLKLCDTSLSFNKYLFSEFRVPSSIHEVDEFRNTYPLPNWHGNHVYSVFNPLIKVEEIHYDHILRINQKRLRKCIDKRFPGASNSLSLDDVDKWFHTELGRAILSASYDWRLAIPIVNVNTSEPQFALPMYYSGLLVLVAILTLTRNNSGKQCYKVLTVLKPEWAYADARTHSPLQSTWLHQVASQSCEPKLVYAKSSVHCNESIPFSCLAYETTDDYYDE